MFPLARFEVSRPLDGLESRSRVVWVQKQLLTGRLFDLMIFTPLSSSPSGDLFVPKAETALWVHPRTGPGTKSSSTPICGLHGYDTT